MTNLAQYKNGLGKARFLAARIRDVGHDEPVPASRERAALRKSLYANLFLGSHAEADQQDKGKDTTSLHHIVGSILPYWALEWLAGWGFSLCTAKGSRLTGCG